MGDGMVRQWSVSPYTHEKLWIPMAGADGTVARHRPASPSTVSRVMARRQLMESPLAPRSTAIPQHEIASYPQEWHEGARSGKYSFIPSYQGWRRGDLPEFAQPEQPSLSRPAERPLSPVLGLVLELNLLNNLLSRYHDGLAGFSSRDSGQIMSMAMILLLIV